MSRTETHDFEYPPGLGLARNGANDLHGFPLTPTYTLSDRRPSVTMGGYSIYTPQNRGDRDYSLDSGNWPMSLPMSVPNRHTPVIPTHHQHLSSLNYNHNNLHRSSPSQPHPTAIYQSPIYTDRDSNLLRQNNHSAPPPPTVTSNNNSSRSTVWWGELEPWMDEEYAKQVCGIMGWDPVNVKVPHPAPDPATGQQSNNPGYCFLTFPTPAHAASVLAQINNGGNAAPVTMPNSSKPFVLNWASSVPSSTPLPTAFSPTDGSMSAAQQPYPKEYSIFVGDLAPETSNSDLVAVFRNPVLGLRNDREPKFIRPFLSCKSAKIMLDPVTGVSRGYGFVRFTDESDQQRALIEMHGLYCLSRPMRISPATAKFKPPPSIGSHDLPQVQFPSGNGNGLEQQPQPVTIALPLPNSSQTKSVSAPIAATTSTNSSLNSHGHNGVAVSTSGSSLSASSSTNSILSSGTGSSASISSSAFGGDDMMNLPNNILVQIAQQYANGTVSPIKMESNSHPFIDAQVQIHQPGMSQEDGSAPRYMISEESWKHHAQARAILGNLIGPNGEQLTSTDPYNTTVFVGGLSPLISEETLRTFFAPFGDIHYVKVPVGKHCGFVQFVRKADAERAIEKMQGFPVGGSRIRLSWGRSQYKAAQAAAQAAQAAALQTQFAPPALVPPALNTTNPSTMTQEQALQLLQKFTMQGYVDKAASHSSSSEGSGSDNTNISGPVYANGGNANGIFTEEKLRAAVLASSSSRDELSQGSFDPYASAPFGVRSASNPNIDSRQNRSNPLSSFSPFSPDANVYPMDIQRRASASYARVDMLPHPSKAYAPGFFPPPPVQTQGTNAQEQTSGSKVSPTARPISASRYGSYLEGNGPSYNQLNRVAGREAPISRPSSSTPGRGEVERDHEALEYDAIHDLNGTLASLELDRPWKSPTDSSESSSGSVQFRMTMAGRTPSP